MEFEQLLKVFFAEHGTTADTLGHAGRSAQEWADGRGQESLAIGERYADGRGLFPKRRPCFSSPAGSSPTSTCWSSTGPGGRAIVETWPDDPRQPPTIPR